MTKGFTYTRDDEKSPEKIRGAIALLRSDIRFYERANFQRNMALCHAEIAMLYDKLGNSKSAKEARGMALAIYKKKEDFVDACEMAEALGKTALAKRLRAKIRPELPISAKKRMRILFDGVQALTETNA